MSYAIYMPSSSPTSTTFIRPFRQGSEGAVFPYICFGLYQISWSILDGFSQVVGFDYINIFQVGGSATQFEYAVKGTGGQVKPFNAAMILIKPRVTHVNSAGMDRETFLFVFSDELNLCRDM
jgi:hypothetical protein